MLSFRKLVLGLPGRAFRVHVTEATAPPAVGQAGRFYRAQPPRGQHRADMTPAIAAALGIQPGRAPTMGELDRLFEGRQADTGRPWPGAQRQVVALDLTLSAPKSLSVLAGLSRTPAEREALLLCHQGANDDAMRFAAAILGNARRGKGGRGGAEPGAVAWTTFLHHTARPTVHVRDASGEILDDYCELKFARADTQVHSHNPMYSVVVTADGHIGSLDTAALHDRVHEIGAPEGCPQSGHHAAFIPSLGEAVPSKGYSGALSGAGQAGRNAAL